MIEIPNGWLYRDALAEILGDPQKTQEHVMLTAAASLKTAITQDALHGKSECIIGPLDDKALHIGRLAAKNLGFVEGEIGTRWEQTRKYLVINIPVHDGTPIHVEEAEDG